MISTKNSTAYFSFVWHGVHTEFSSDGYTTTARRLAFGSGAFLRLGSRMAMLLVSFCLHNFVLYSCINYTLLPSTMTMYRFFIVYRLEFSQPRHARQSITPANSRCLSPSHPDDQ
jgi:hypothetical protein